MLQLQTLKTVGALEETYADQSFRQALEKFPADRDSAQGVGSLKHGVEKELCWVSPG